MKFAHQTWSTPAFGIVVTLINKHGDADYFSTHSSSFALTDEGKAGAELLVAILEELNWAVARNIEASLEDVCELLAPRVHVDSVTLAQKLNDFLVCDARFDEHMAEPCAYTLSVTDERGTSFALYKDAAGTERRYRKLNSTHDAHLMRWA